MLSCVGEPFYECVHDTHAVPRLKERTGLLMRADLRRRNLLIPYFYTLLLLLLLLCLLPWCALLARPIR